MAKINIRPVPSVYNFIKNGYEFQCIIDWRYDEAVHPIDSLILDLEECLSQLKQMPRFEIKKPFGLPPLNPIDTSEK